MDDPIKLAVAVAALAFLAEWLLERFFGKLVQGEMMVYLSAVVGIALCLLFRLNAVALLGLPEPLFEPYSGQVITGILVGAGSNAVHKFFPPKE